jgi:hypothetical protein
MRKGFSIVEMLFVVMILPFVFLILNGLFTTLLADIPRSYRIAQESMTLQNLLERMQEDMDKASGLPDSLAGHRADDKQILITLPDGVICYQQKDGQIVRRRLTDSPQDRVEEKHAWSLPNTKVEWAIREKNAERYAVEVSTHFAYQTRGRWRKTTANSRVYFGGALR